MSIRQRSTMLIPWIWGQHQVNPWGFLVENVPMITWCTTEDRLIQAARYVLLQEDMPSRRYRTFQKEDTLLATTSQK